MKKLSFYIAISILLSSCASTIHEIGGLNMLSDRHIDPNGHYQKLAIGVGTAKKEIKASKAENIEAAINQILDQIPGAEYLTNVKIYAVYGDYLAVSGDVWGHKSGQTIAANSSTQAKTGKNNSELELGR